MDTYTYTHTSRPPACAFIPLFVLKRGSEDISRVEYLKWDPSGRYLVDAIQQPMGNSYYKYSYDNGARLFYLHFHACVCIICAFACLIYSTTTHPLNTPNATNQPDRVPPLDVPGAAGGARGEGAVLPVLVAAPPAPAAHGGAAAQGQEGYVTRACV